jgi:uncharacterized protein YjbI with pentapeptide repeats
MKRAFKDGIPFKPVKIGSYSDIFSSLAKIALNGYKGEYVEAALSAMDLAAAFGTEGTEERLGWDLVNRSTVQAIGDLLKDNQNSLIVKDNVTFIEKIKTLKYDKEIKVDGAFFKNPKDSEFVKDIQSILLEWFSLAGIEKHKSETMAARFPAFFVYALNDEWVINSEKYKRLLARMETPFSAQVKMEDDWEKYKAWLDKQTKESIFSEAFSLSQIYIPLCAYYKENNENKEKRTVVDLHDAINEWLTKDDKVDAVRIISGGPGSGKSSFLKMFAAGVAATHNVLFISLHHLSLEDNIEKDINNFLVSNKYFKETPIGKEGKLLIIFDGLDELSMLGKTGVEAAHNFSRQIGHLLENYNDQKHQISILITGRDLPVSEIETDFRKSGQTLHVLPYYVGKEKEFQFLPYYVRNEKEFQSPAFEYIDEKKLLSEDRRNLWWEKYGKLTGKNYNKLPEELNRFVSLEITSQPLLNYLLALSYVRGKIQFSDKTNRNALYSDLIRAVYERGYQGEQSRHRLMEHIEEPEFEQVLEEIAVSAWQGAGRTATVKAIKKRCEKSNISDIITRFQKSAEKGVLNLLIAFYFRHSGKTWKGDETFEFTHKSFGEYLTARRIVRQLQKTQEALESKKTEENGWTYKTALVNWIELCRNAPLDADIHTFLYDEMLLHERLKVKSWQDTLSGLISHMLEFGMPFEKISPRPKYIDETWQSRNAEEALLAALSACSRCTNEVSNIKWKDDKAAGKWLLKLCRHPHDFVFAYSCLNNLNLRDANLINFNLRDANLRGANLRDAYLSDANLTGANLINVNLRDAVLIGANLSDANLRSANLSDADLTGANLRGANLRGANLINASLRDADLIGANFSNANLRRADLRDADLSYAKLTDVDLSNADLSVSVIFNNEEVPLKQLFPDAG